MREEDALDRAKHNPIQFLGDVLKYLDSEHPDDQIYIGGVFTPPQLLIFRAMTSVIYTQRDPLDFD